MSYEQDDLMARYLLAIMGLLADRRAANKRYRLKDNDSNMNRRSKVIRRKRVLSETTNKTVEPVPKRTAFTAVGFLSAAAAVSMSTAHRREEWDVNTPNWMQWITTNGRMDMAPSWDAASNGVETLLTEARSANTYDEGILLLGLAYKEAERESPENRYRKLLHSLYDMSRTQVASINEVILAVKENNKENNVEIRYALKITLDGRQERTASTAAAPRREEWSVNTPDWMQWITTNGRMDMTPSWDAASNGVEKLLTEARVGNSFNDEIRLLGVAYKEAHMEPPKKKYMKLVRLLYGMSPTQVASIKEVISAVMKRDAEAEHGAGGMRP